MEISWTCSIWDGSCHLLLLKGDKCCCWGGFCHSLSPSTGFHIHYTWGSSDSWGEPFRGCSRLAIEVGNHSSHWFPLAVLWIQAIPFMVYWCDQDKTVMEEKKSSCWLELWQHLPGNDDVSGRALVSPMTEVMVTAWVKCVAKYSVSQLLRSHCLRIKTRVFQLAQHQQLSALWIAACNIFI